MPRIKIENKHTYLNIDTTVDGNVVSPTLATVKQDLTNFRYFKPAYPVQGTDDDDRIGRKIMTTALISEGFLELRTGNAPNTIGDIYDGYISELSTNGHWGQNYEVNPLNWPIDISIRHMIVEFDNSILGPKISNAQSPINIRDWFRNLFIQTGTNLMPSNRMEVKRESTPFTGQFKILYDKVHHLSFQHPLLHYKINLPYKRTLNFDSTTEQSSPTNDRLIYELFIGPTNIFTDYGSKTFGDHLLATSNTEAEFIARVCNLQSTLKLNFIDI